VHLLEAHVLGARGQFLGDCPLRRLSKVLFPTGDACRPRRKPLSSSNTTCHHIDMLVQGSATFSRYPAIVAGQPLRRPRCCSGSSRAPRTIFVAHFSFHSSVCLVQAKRGKRRSSKTKRVPHCWSIATASYSYEEAKRWLPPGIEPWAKKLTIERVSSE